MSKTMKTALEMLYDREVCDFVAELLLAAANAGWEVSIKLKKGSNAVEARRQRGDEEASAADRSESEKDQPGEKSNETPG